MPRLRPIVEPQSSPSPSPQLEAKEGQEQDVANLGGAPAPDSTEPEVVVDESPAPSEAEVALKKQLEALQNSEKQQRELANQYLREREEAVRQAQEYQTNLQRSQKEAQDNEENFFNSSLTAAKNALDKADADHQAAMDAGDGPGIRAAVKAISAAQGDIRDLERGIEGIAQRKKLEEEQAKYAQQQPQRDPRMNQPHVVAWMQKNRHLLSDHRMNTKIASAFYQSEEEGIEPYSMAQITRIEEIVGMRPNPEQAEPESQPQKGS